MSGKPFNTKALGRIGKAMLKAAGGSVEPKLNTQVNVPPTGKQEAPPSPGMAWMFNTGDTVWGNGMPQFPPEAQPDPYFTELLGPPQQQDPDNMDQAGFFSRWGGMTAEGIPDFGQGTLADPMAPERRRREWEAMKYEDDLVYGKRAKKFQKSLSARDKRDRIDDARSLSITASQPSKSPFSIT